MEYAIEVTDLMKNYGDFTAVNKVSFMVKKNTCFGILGPNGAGKTTILEILEGIKESSGGQVKVLGMNLATQLSKVQPRIGVQLQENHYFDFLDVTQLLTFFINLREAAANEKSPLGLEDLLGMVSLTEKRNAKISELSGGQKQRFSIALSMIGDPDVLFLDEPTAALDPQSRHHIWDFVKDLMNKKNKTIILTTHFMEEAERLCDELMIMDHGKIISQGEPHELVRNLSKFHTINIQTSADGFSTDQIKKVDGVMDCKWDDDTSEFCIVTEKPVGTIRALFTHAEEKNIDIEGFHTHKASLEDVFLYETGKVLRD